MRKNIALTGRSCLRLVNPKLENLEGLIWEPWQDLALVLCIRGQTDDGKDFWANIPAAAEGIEKISIERAKDNAREMLAETAEIKDLREKLKELSEEIKAQDTSYAEAYSPWDDDETEGLEDLVVVTTSDGKYGAAVITLPETQKELTRRLGDYYIIPSSKHEVL